MADDMRKNVVINPDKESLWWRGFSSAMPARKPGHAGAVGSGDGQQSERMQGPPNRPVEHFAWDDVRACSTDLGESHNTWTHRSEKESARRVWFLSVVTRRR